MVLVPCYFCVHHPIALANPLLRPILVFPIPAESRLLAQVRFADLSDADTVITDSGADPASVRAMSDAGPQIVIA